MEEAEHLYWSTWGDRVSSEAGVRVSPQTVIPRTLHTSATEKEAVNQTLLRL